MIDRRKFLSTAGVGLAAASVPGLASACHTGEKKPFTKVKLGIASYSLRHFSLEESLGIAIRCGVDRMTLKSMHLPLDLDKAAIGKDIERCRQKGITIYGGGVIKMRSEEDVDNAFEYASAAGMDMIVGDPGHDMLGYINEKVQEYDIKLAIHNHGPGDHQLYPSALDAYEKVKHMDKRMGMCMDIGHTKRIDRDPVEDLKAGFDRVFDIHIKDVTAASEKGHTCAVGRGVIDIVSFIKAVIELGYTGTLALEYESEKEDPVPAMMESFGYIRGVLAAL